MRMYEIEAWGRKHNVTVHATKYVDNGNLTVCLDDPMEGPYATITVNLGRLNDGFAYVDTNNCPWAVKFLEENGLAEFTGKTCRSGFCEYPLYKFNMEKIVGGMFDD